MFSLASSWFTQHKIDKAQLFRKYVLLPFQLDKALIMFTDVSGVNHMCQHVEEENIFSLIYFKSDIIFRWQCEEYHSNFISIF